jgi:hypothetical protein
MTVEYSTARAERDVSVNMPMSYLRACREARRLSRFGAPAYVHHYGRAYTVLQGRFARMGAVRRYARGRVI